jgi:hypothetical protein
MDAAMDIQQLRESAQFVEKGMIVSIVVAALAMVALGATTWLSIKYNSSLRAEQSDALDRHKAEQATKLEQEVASAQERITQLEKAAAEADERAAQASRRAAEVEKIAAEAKARAAELEKRAVEAAAPAQQDRAAAEPAAAAAPVESAKPEKQQSPLVASLARFTGAKAAIYVVGEASEAAEVGASIDGALNEAGWTSAVWKWSGVDGILGLVVLTKEGVDPSADEAAAGIVEAFRAAGFHAAKANWPADADWRRVRGTLTGPQAPAPTDAPIRIVVGAKAR